MQRSIEIHGTQCSSELEGLVVSGLHRPGVNPVTIGVSGIVSKNSSNSIFHSGRDILKLSLSFLGSLLNNLGATKLKEFSRSYL